MTIAGCIDPYHFNGDDDDDLGATGCAEHNDPGCYCDVKLTGRPTPPVLLPLPKVAEEVLSFPPTRYEVERYFSLVLGAKENHESRLRDGVTVDDLAEAREGYLNLLGTPEGDGCDLRHDLRKHLAVFKRAGLTLRETARYLGRSIPEVVRWYMHGDESMAHCYLLAQVEDDVIAGKYENHKQIVAATGLTYAQVSHFCQQRKLHVGVQARLLAGGGFKNSPETVAAVRRLHCQGLKPKAILEAVHRLVPESRDTLTYMGVVGLTRKR